MSSVGLATHLLHGHPCSTLLLEDLVNRFIVPLQHKLNPSHFGTKFEVDHTNAKIKTNRNKVCFLHRILSQFSMFLQQKQITFWISRMFFTGFSVKIHKFFKTFFFYSQHVILENTIRVPLLKHAIWIQVKIWGKIFSATWRDRGSAVTAFQNWEHNTWMGKKIEEVMQRRLIVVLCIIMAYIYQKIVCSSVPRIYYEKNLIL